MKLTFNFKWLTENCGLLVPECCLALHNTLEWTPLPGPSLSCLTGERHTATPILVCLQTQCCSSVWKGRLLQPELEEESWDC